MHSPGIEPGSPSGLGPKTHRFSEVANHCQIWPRKLQIGVGTTDTEEGGRTFAYLLVPIERNGMAP
jgi:hypothetical protein